MTKKLAEILLVEDNEGDVILTQEAMEEAKINNTMHVVRDGDEALDFIFKRNGFEDMQTPDVILLDLNLPRTSGREVLAEMKAHEHTKDISVIVLTSSAADTDVLQEYGLNSDCYLVKPLNVDTFIELSRKIAHFYLDIVSEEV